MKLQLDENTLNAYINEAIRQEINEGGLFKAIGKGIGKAAKGVGKGVKGAARGTKNYAKALTGNRGAVKKSEKMLKSLKNELAAVEKEQKAIWGTANSGARGHELATRRNTLVRRINSVEASLAKAKAGKTLARTTTAAAAGGLGVGYLAGHSGRGGQNPDAPWNDAPEGDGGQTPGDGGFDGTFPWDTTEPAWTPRNPKPSTPTPTTPAQSEPKPSTPAAPIQGEPEPTQPVESKPQSVRPALGSLAPVTTNFNIPTGVTSNTKPTIQRKYAPGTDPNNVNKWNNTANFRRLSGQIERGVAPEKAVKTLQNRRERQEKKYDRISAKNGGQNQNAAQ